MIRRSWFILIIATHQPWRSLTISYHSSLLDTPAATQKAPQKSNFIQRTILHSRDRAQNDLSCELSLGSAAVCLMSWTIVCAASRPPVPGQSMWK